MARATHRDYLHPHHLRVEADGDVLCVSPSADLYGKLYRPTLPVFGASPADADLPRHSSARPPQP